MAGYFLHVNTITRGKGSSVTKAAAYRAGERIRDERSRAVHDYTDRTDVVHAEIILPADQIGRVDMEWALNRSVLWNAVQQSGRQWNSRLAREVLVHLPGELTPIQRTTLIRSFSRELADRYRSAVDFAIHKPRPHADQRNNHAHILMTSRQVGPHGVGARTTLELSGTERHALGLGPSKDEFLWIRERWAQVANEALREAGVAARIDHRSYQDQGIDREPQARIPRNILYSERSSGMNSPAGDDIRARHRERVEARAKGSEELARVVKRQRQENHQRAMEWSERRLLQKKIPQGALTREQLNQKRREYRYVNRDEINRKRREHRTANVEEVNRKQRERRNANIQEVRRKDRERYRERMAAQKTARRSLSLQESQQQKGATRALASAERNARSRGQASPTQSAAESVKNWLAFRENQKQLPAKQSLSDWIAYRESQTQAESPKSPSRDRSRDLGTAKAGNQDHPATEKSSKRGRGNDVGL